MVYATKATTIKEVSFLKSEKFISFTKQANADNTQVKDGVLPAGSVYPANDATAEGITISDVNVSKGAQPVGVIVDGHILIERLPVKPSDAAQKAMRLVKLYDANGKLLAVPTA